MKYRYFQSKFLMFAFYSVVMAGLLFYVWNEQNIVIFGGTGPLYHNLRDYPAYVKRGFNPGATQQLPSEAPEKWLFFPASSRRIKGSMPNLPERRLFSPWGNKAEEFTIMFLVEINEETLAYLEDNPSIIPGGFFAGIGENWEIYFNGALILSEVHLDESGQIRERRTWRDVYFPLDRSLIVQGTNFLTLRIIGDPSYEATGLFYTEGIIYLDDYSEIAKRQRNFILMILCGIYGFAGIYYLMLFFSIRDKKEIFNLYFGIFSILLCIYSFTRHGVVNLLIPSSNIILRLEYFSLMLLVPAIGFFVESLGRGRITKITWGYLVFCLYLAITQLFFCFQYGEEVILLWDIIALLYFSYVLIYDVIYFYFWDKKEAKKNRESSTIPIGNILFGMIISYICGIVDAIDILFFQYAFNLFQYGTFVLHVGMIFTLAQRFGRMYKRLEKSNVMLEMTVQERTMELKEQTDIAIQASQAKSDFLAIMSHELRTPLHAVIGLSGIVLNRDKLTHDSKNDIQQIYQSGSSLLEIINDILDISKIEAGSFELVPAIYETAPFIRETVNLNLARLGFQEGPGFSPVNFVLEIDEDFPAKLTGDKLRVKQILNNILSNAIKYTKEGTITLKISWHVLQKDAVKKAMIHFTVQDTGIGIRIEDKEKLFNKYHQLDTELPYNIEGTGLGLSIAKNLVEMMDGNITVESEHGKGSVFLVTIVQEFEDETGIGKETAEDLRSLHYVSGRKEVNNRIWIPGGKVLVVDDLPENLTVALGLLKPYGLSVDTAASGMEAIKKIKSGSYDLLFIDHMMPEMDGVETVAAIREWEKEQPEHPAIPIVAMTANAMRGMKEFYLEHGFQDYLLKPVNLQVLNNVLKKWIGTQEANDEEPETDSSLSENFAMAIQAQRLDVLNHYRVAFENDLTVKVHENDSEYYRRFTALVESLMTNDLTFELTDQAAALIEAGQEEDAQEIRKILPPFYRELKNQLAEKTEKALEAIDHWEKTYF